MKLSSITIEIPKPCHANWDTMTVAEQGRFCALCSKTVIDFSMMSDEAVLKFFEKKEEKICGRFTEQQLNKPMVRIPKKLKEFLYVLSYVFLLSSPLCIEAQRKPMTADEIRKLPTLTTGQTFVIQDSSDRPACSNKIEKQDLSLTLKVLDADGKPLDFASVTIFSAEDTLLFRGKTNNNGMITIPKLKNGNYKVKTSHIGYEINNSLISLLGVNQFLEVKLIKMPLNKLYRMGLFRTGSERLIDPSNPGKKVMKGSDINNMPLKQ